MKRDLKSNLEEMKKDIKYLEDKIDDMIDIYREHFHSMSSTSKGK